MNSKVERWKNGAVSGIVFMEANKRDFLIAGALCLFRFGKELST